MLVSPPRPDPTPTSAPAVPLPHAQPLLVVACGWALLLMLAKCVFVPFQVVGGLPEDTPEAPEIPTVKGHQLVGGPQMLQLRYAGCPEVNNVGNSLKEKKRQPKNVITQRRKRKRQETVTHNGSLCIQRHPGDMSLVCHDTALGSNILQLQRQLEGDRHIAAFSEASGVENHFLSMVHVTHQ